MASLSFSKSTDLSADLDDQPPDGSTTSSVFLGGSCNPTLWRKEVAIPYLSKYNVSYYNPQVSCWSPELIQLETQAKREAKVHLFVIDRQTRSVAALVEVAYLMASRPSALVLVMYPYEASDDISESELSEQRAARKMVQSLAKVQRVHVYTALLEALPVTVEKMAGPRQKAAGTSGRSLRTSFKTLAVKSAHLAAPLHTLWRWVLTRCQRPASPHVTVVSSDPSVLEPVGPHHRLVAPGKLPAASGRVLLIVVPATRRALLELVLASYCLAAKPDMLILCIQQLQDDTWVDGLQVSEEEVRDYNRGRSYLAELALEVATPVFSDPQAALERAVQLLL